MTKHYIKSWAHFFDAIKRGDKLHDLRKMDREYNVGDILVLERYDNINGNYTGEQLEVEISYITSNRTPCAFSSSALDRDYAILSLRLLNQVNVPDCNNPDNPPETAYIPRERTPRLVLKSEKMVNPVTPNPNAEYYQNGEGSRV